jgi:hypothetical protein
MRWLPAIHIADLLAVYHPWHAELIDKHAKSGGPKGFL